MNLSDAFASSGRPRRRRRRVGRGPGSGHGRTAGRGQKGGGARSGWRERITNEGGQMPLFRRLPKRGFNNAAFAKAFEVVNVGSLARFRAGSHVGPEELRKKKMARSGARVKILAGGEIAKPLTVRAHGFSRAATEKIRAAGGTVEVI